MDDSGAKSLSALGFLTVVESPQHGLFGGLLVLNPSGHPVEFHCTAPVKPNRAQQILYGKTLKPFLYGQQIGQTLLSKAQPKPPVVLTDVPSMLALRDSTATPVVFLAPASDESADEPADAADVVYRVDAAHTAAQATGPKSAIFRVGAYDLALSTAEDKTAERLVKQLATVAERIDLAEPFERIREAIQEAQRIGD